MLISCKSGGKILQFPEPRYFLVVNFAYAYEFSVSSCMKTPKYMRAYFFMLLLACSVPVVSCHKNSNSTPAPVVISGDNLTATGTLELQGFTTYMYGSHILRVDSATLFVLKSTTLNLDPFVGMRVSIQAVNMHYSVDLGPDLYNVMAIAAAP